MVATGSIVSMQFNDIFEEVILHNHCPFIPKKEYKKYIWLNYFNCIIYIPTYYAMDCK